MFAMRRVTTTTVAGVSLCQLPVSTAVLLMLLLPRDHVSGSATYTFASVSTDEPSSSVDAHLMTRSVAMTQPDLLTAAAAVASSSNSSSARVHIAIRLTGSLLNASSSSSVARSSWSLPLTQAAADDVGNGNMYAVDYGNGSMTRPYFGDFFHWIYEAYIPVHGYLSLLVCIFGIFANILNIIVLTR